LSISEATHRFCGPALIALGAALAATTPTGGTAFVLSLIVTANGAVHTWDYAYETSLTRDSAVVALLATLPDGARIPEIAHTMGTSPRTVGCCLLRLFRQGLITTADDTAPITERLFRLSGI
jgi:hypothetical protein